MKKPKHVPVPRLIIWLIAFMLSFCIWFWVETPKNPQISFFTIITIGSIWFAVELFSLQRSVDIDPRLYSYRIFYIFRETSYRGAMVLALYIAVVPLITFVRLIFDQEMRLLLADYFREINSHNIFLIVGFVSFFYTLLLYSNMRTILLLNGVEYIESIKAHKEEEREE